MSKNKENLPEKDVKKSKTEEVNKESKTTSPKVKFWNKKLSEKNLAIAITAIALATLMVGASAFFLVDAIINDGFFSYMNSDMSQYIELDKSLYKDIDLNVDIAKPKDVEVDVAILALLAQDKGDALYDGNTVTAGLPVITPGAELNIWYRGYLLDDDGNPIEVTGLSNLAGAFPASLEIGSGNFVSGFEVGLVGINPQEYSKFVKITDAETVITSEHVAYVSFSRLVDGGDSSKDTIKGASVRIDLSSDEVDKNFGAGFKDKLLSAKIGEKIGEDAKFDAVIDGKTYHYSDVVIDFVTDCETNPIKVTAYFPYNYSTANLRNETAIFEVYIESGVFYEEQKFDDDYVKELIAREGSTITLEKLQAYDGEALTEKYRNFVKETIDRLYEDEYKAVVSETYWNYVLSKAKVKKYPKAQVEKLQKEYIADVEYQFSTSGGSIENQYTGSYDTYSTLDTYACAYLGLGSSTDWRSYLYSMCESLVKERLVLYYLLGAENMKPSSKELKEMIAEEKQIYLDEYVQQYLDYEEKTREDFANEKEYQEYVDARAAEIFGYYDDDYFQETAIYNLVMEAVVDWPNVITLDERRAYPATK